MAAPAGIESASARAAMLGTAGIMLDRLPSPMPPAPGGNLDGGGPERPRQLRRELGECRSDGSLKHAFDERSADRRFPGSDVCGRQRYAGRAHDATP